jgi:DNA-directed RNA polymerase subunit RPC12/RpoP
VVKQAVYRVPTKEETDPLRTYPTTAYKCLDCECSFVWKDNANDPPECPSCGSYISLIV